MQNANSFPPASAVGAPHRRDRVWIVANPGGEQHQGDRPPLSGEIAAELSRAAADAAGSNDGLSASGACERQESEFGSRAIAADVADALRDDEQGLVSGCFDEEERSRPIKRSSRPRGDGVGWWAAKPDVDRVAHGISAELYGGVNADAQEFYTDEIAKDDPEFREMRVLRSSRISGEAPSRLLGAGSRGNSVPSMPHQGGPEGRASTKEKTEKLQGMRAGVHADAQQEAYDVQSRMPFGNWPHERGEEMGVWTQEPDVAPPA
jgi:hypothetical protein